MALERPNDILLRLERGVKRAFSIGMPQMAVGCLSEMAPLRPNEHIRVRGRQPHSATVLLSVVDLAAYLCLLSAEAERSSFERGMRESARASSPR
jgi:hypothetical protein